jgi:hypothetical protein
MTKSVAFIAEVLHVSNPPLRQLTYRPYKPQKHRYERRKIREFLRLADWMEETTITS